MKAFALLALVACSSEPPPGLAVASVADLGKFPLPSAVTLGRDGGNAGQLGGKLLWTFGDTFTSMTNSVDGSSVLSATAGWSTAAAPLDLVQPVDGKGIPAQLVPYTAAELAQNQADPLNGWALWPGALIDTGAPAGLLVFQRVRRMGGSGFETQGIGTARIAVDATVATRAPADLFAAPDPLFIPTSVIDGNVYAFACATTGFLNLGCKVGRAPVARADERAAYAFYDGSAWQPDATRAAEVIDHVGGGLTVSYNPYLGRYLAVSGAVLSSTVRLRTADHVEGPWSAAVEIAPDSEYLEGSSYNYIIIEHPELRSPDGRQIVISYSRPTDPFRGDVRLLRITLR